MLDYSRDVSKFLDKLPPKQFKQIAKKIITLGKDPLPHDSLKMSGVDNRYRVDIGEYRVVYEFEAQAQQNFVAVLVVGKRNDDEVYKKAKRIA